MNTPDLEELERRVNESTFASWGPTRAEMRSLIAKAREADELRAEVARLRAYVTKAETTFRWYGDLHAAKPDPDKAKRNYDLADEARAALGEKP